MYVELNALTAFSFLEGASRPEAIIRRAAELGYPAIGITDRDGFHGSARAHHTAKEAGIRALVGTTLQFPGGTRFPVLCSSREGYRILCRHVTDRNLLPDETHTIDTKGHLIAMTGDRGGPSVLTCYVEIGLRHYRPHATF